MKNLFDYPDAVVYLIQYSNEPIYKIGLTKNLVKRFQKLSILVPHQLEVIHCIYAEDPKWLESYWHSRFENKRRLGSGYRRKSEWFDLSPTDVHAFKSILVCRKSDEKLLQKTLVSAPSNNTIYEEAIFRILNVYVELTRDYPHRATKLANSYEHQVRELNLVARNENWGRSTVKEKVERWEAGARTAAKNKIY